MQFFATLLNLGIIYIIVKHFLFFCLDQEFRIDTSRLGSVQLEYKFEIPIAWESMPTFRSLLSKMESTKLKRRMSWISWRWVWPAKMVGCRCFNAMKSWRSHVSHPSPTPANWPTRSWTPPITPGRRCLVAVAGATPSVVAEVSQGGVREIYIYREWSSRKRKRKEEREKETDTWQVLNKGEKK